MNGIKIVSHFMAKTRGRVCYLKMIRPLGHTSYRQYVSDGAKAREKKSEVETVTDEVQFVELKTNPGKTQQFFFNKEEATVLFHKPSNSVISLDAGQSHEQRLASDKFVAKDVVQLVDGMLKKETPLEEIENTSPATVRLTNAINPGALDCYKQGIQLKQLPKFYLMLSKSRLTALVVATEIVGYAMAPSAFDLKTFLLAAGGTALLSSAANTTNQFFEVPFDSQMARTKNRVLVRAVITPLHAATFAFTCATTGLSILYFGINGLTAALGATNLILYTFIYTPMKRMSIANTWLGSVVGAIPPVMGWTACTGTFDAGALILGGILFAWQFPHFNALSWNLRGDYSRAGYRMMSVTDPRLCRVTSLRYSVVLLGLCSLAPWMDVTTYIFALDSLPFNAYLIYLSWRFYEKADSNSSRKLFRFSLIHLPAIMMLMIISKKDFGDKKKSKENKDLLES